MSTALMLTRLRTYSASLTAPAVLSLQLLSFYCWLKHGGEHAFPRAELMPNLLA